MQTAGAFQELLCLCGFLSQGTFITRWLLSQGQTPLLAQGSQDYVKRMREDPGFKGREIDAAS